MKSFIFMNSVDASAFGRNWFWFFLWGLALTILGMCAIGAAAYTTFLSIVFIGFLVLFGGLVIILDSFSFWWKRRGFGSHLLVGILYTAVGIMLVAYPVVSSIYLTFLMGIFYLVLGLFRLYYSSSLKAPRWGWNFFNGLISVLLGALILMNWPASGLYIIGLFVGIDLLFAGLAYMMAALGAKASK